jgi:hypothetical protein
LLVGLAIRVDLGIGEVDGKVKSIYVEVHVLLYFLGSGTGLGRVARVVAGCHHSHVFRVFGGGVLTGNLHAEVERGAEPHASSQLIEFARYFGVVSEIFLSASLQRHGGDFEFGAVFPVPVLETDVKVAFGVGEVEVPDFDGEAEGGVLGDIDGGGGRVLVFVDLGGGADRGEVESVQDHACKSYDDGHNDAQLDESSSHRLVL